MKTLLDYQVLAPLGESLQTQVFLVGSSEAPAARWILKKIKPAYCSPELAEYLRQQIGQLAALHLPHVILPELHYPARDSLFMLYPACPGTLLTHWLAVGPHPVAEVLAWAIALADRLEACHRAGHIHKALKPNNVLLQAPHTVQLLDDVHVFDINQISHFIYDETFRRGTLPYLAPEQTGRIKFSINYTTDLYALGIVLYEALSGQPPFYFDDPIAIIHSHLAETPPPLHTLNPSIPEILSQIVALLLEKAPEKRYQTAAGVKADLMQCVTAYRETGNIAPFPLKQKDFSNRITIPSLMVGRDAEKQTLLDEYQKACSGVFRAALISGLSGIGKTRLIQELQLPIVSHRGYYTSGKFDQFRKHIPYSTLIQAFSTLIKTFLTEDSVRIAYWRERISAAVGEHGRLICDLVPELSLILGPQPEVADLPPVEARNRFNDTAGRFLACLASAEHPLTLFIDDLQWCDGATFDFLERMFDNALDYPYLFWLGAYRHNEVDASHRLTRLIQRVQANNRPLLEIRLEALGLTEVNQMTAYILNTFPARTQALSEVIFHTSSGNPLFVNESLRWLHSYRHLHLSEDGYWTWDNEHLRHAAIPASALDLFKDKIAKLPETARELLQIAASLGARFEARDLALTADLSLSELYRALAESFNQNILQRDKDQLYFFHDQVQAAAESFMDGTKKRAVHARIAEAMIAAIPEGQDWESLPNLFSIVEHLAEGRPLEQSSDSRLREARFCYRAGIAAMKALAMENANHFFRESLALYPKETWDEDYEFLFTLHKYLARTEMAIGNQPASEAILNTLLQHARGDLDKADCLYEQTTGLSSMGNFNRAIELGNRGLDFFQRRIPDDDALALQRSAEIIERLHREHQDVWQTILDVEPSSDRAVQIETGIYSELIPDYYLAGMVPQLYLAAIQSTENCLAGGVDESVIYGFSMMGLYLQRQDQYEWSFRYEDLGLALAHRYPDTFGATKGINGILWTNMHNRRDCAHIIEQCQQNIHRGKHCGDLYNAGLSYGPFIWHNITQGRDLKRVIAIAEECIAFSRKFNLSLSLGLAESALAGWSDYLHDDRVPWDDATLQAKLAQWEADKHVVSIGGYYTLKGLACHYLGRYAEAAQALTQAQPYLRGLSDNILNRLWYVFRYLNSWSLGDLSPEENEQRAHCWERVTTWAALGPALPPYLAAMRAARAAREGDFSETRKHYLDAIDHAQQQGYTLLDAYLHERFGEVLVQWQHRHARHYLTEAIQLYGECGAEVKVRQLKERYAIAISDGSAFAGGQPSWTQMLDVDYLVRATRAITRQLDWRPLLQTILQAVMERLGARTGYLLTALENQTPSVVARGIKQDQVTVAVAAPGERLATDTLSWGIVNYVFRSGEMVVLSHANQEGDFITDETVRAKQLKSVFCVPLLKQRQVIGVLYLENDLISCVFATEQIELARLLSAQAAIALENTYLIQQMRQTQQAMERLNTELEQRVAQRTASLNKVNEELKNFAYIVSHDLKAPLRAITQLSTWLEEDYASVLDEDGRQQLALLRSRARRMHEMIDGILQYSRVGRVEEPWETVDCNRLIADIIESLAPPEWVEIRVAPNLPVLRTQKLRLYQVFQNLLDNAIKYNDKPRCQISVTVEEHAEDWRFCIADNGPGIEAKYQDKIFRLFQTLAPRDKTDSTGIGLSLVEKIITHLSGRVWLESGPGQGCRFFFTLPKPTEEHMDNEQPQTDSVGRG